MAPSVNEETNEACGTLVPTFSLH